jgi:hypothetical protein
MGADVAAKSPSRRMADRADDKHGNIQRDPAKIDDFLHQLGGSMIDADRGFPKELGDAEGREWCGDRRHGLRDETRREEFCERRVTERPQ